MRGRGGEGEKEGERERVREMGRDRGQHYVPRYRCSPIFVL